LAGIFESLLGGASTPDPHQQRAPDPAPRPVKIDPNRFSQDEMDQRRAALVSRFGREVNVEQEQMLDREERLKRESGQSYR
jgi:hypothetical protein